MQCGMSLPLQGTAIMSGTAAVTSAGTQLLETGSIDPTQVLVDTAMAGGTFFVGTGLSKLCSRYSGINKPRTKEHRKC